MFLGPGAAPQSFVTNLVNRGTLPLIYPRDVPMTSEPAALDRILSAGLIVGPAAFISAWVASGSVTPGYSPTRDHISDLAAVHAPTRRLMNAGFTTFVLAITLATVPARRLVGTPGSIALGANAALSIGIMLAPLGRSPHGDRVHQLVAGLGYVVLAVTAPAAAPALAKRSRRLALVSVATGLGSLACLGLSFIRPDSGFWQRAGITTTDAWLIGIGALGVTNSGPANG